MSQHAYNGISSTVRNNQIRGKLKQHPSLETRLQDIEEVKKLNISEETFSYYDDERPSIHKGPPKVLKPQFMYDAGAARKREQERESRERYEAIRRRFWKKWAPNNEVRHPKVLDKGMTKLHPFNLALMRPTNLEETTTLKQSRAMYKESMTRAALDAIEFGSNVKTPTKRMQHLPKMIHALKSSIEVSENQRDNLFEQQSETSSTENLIEWIKHLNPYEGDEVNTNKRIRISVSSRYSNMRVKKSVVGTFSRKPSRFKELNKDKGVGTQKIGSMLTHVHGEEVPPGRVSVQHNYSTITMEQLVRHSEPQPHSGKVINKHKVSGSKKTRDLNEEIEMVKNLIIPTVDTDSKTDHSQVDLSMVQHWQERRLYYQKQEGINYDRNYNHTCLQSVISGPDTRGPLLKQRLRSLDTGGLTVTM